MELPKKKLDILNTAEDLFTRFGFKRITVEEICQKSNVSKMTFYKYFQNKNELIKAWLNKLIDDGYERLDEVNKQNIPFTEKIKFILNMKKEYTDKMSNEFLEEYLENTEPGMNEWMGEVYKKSMDKFLKFMKEAQEAGDIRKNMKPEFFLFVANKLMELPQDPELQKLYPNYTDLVLEINNFLFYGLLAR
ncbi:MAG: TetR/AcrR family transcriptional regulator [Ignavibacteria bacterium]|jgi:AcrR family transcriptional regulator